MDDNIKIALKEMTRINIIIGFIILMVLRIIFDFRIGVAFITGVIIYNLCIIVKAYTFQSMIEEVKVSKINYLLVTFLVVLICAIGGLIFKGNLKAVFSYCIGLLFNFVTMGYAFLRKERK